MLLEMSAQPGKPRRSRALQAFPGPLHGGLGAAFRHIRNGRCCHCFLRHRFRRRQGLHLLDFRIVLLGLLRVVQRYHPIRICGFGRDVFG